MTIPKFRAWHKKLKEMFLVAEIGFGPDGAEEIAVFRPNITWPNPAVYENYLLSEIELMQCTGLQDKHGADIYAGDIIQYSYLAVDDRYQEYHGNEKRTQFKGTIILDCNGALVMPIGSGSVFLLYDITKPEEPAEIKENTAEVIGNIYQNPERWGNHDETDATGS